MNHEQATTDQSDVEPSRNVSNAKKLSKEHYIELAAFCDSIYDRGKNIVKFSSKFTGLLGWKLDSIQSLHNWHVRYREIDSAQCKVLWTYERFLPVRSFSNS